MLRVPITKCLTLTDKVQLTMQPVKEHTVKCVYDTVIESMKRSSKILENYYLLHNIKIDNKV